MDPTIPHGHHDLISITEVPVDEHCTGQRWVVGDQNSLARILAIVAMGQAAHAARIVADLCPAQPELNLEALRGDAKKRLSLKGRTTDAREHSRYHRDGLIFEAISWCAAHQSTGGNALVRDPHLNATTQGLDGLMIELEDGGSAIGRLTVFEDKCSENPRAKFRDEVIPAFLDYHHGNRASALLASAATLLQHSGMDGTESISAAERSLNPNYRTYRSSLAVSLTDDSEDRRRKLFKGYDALDGVSPYQRIGAVLLTGPELRPWFDKLANDAISYVDDLSDEEL